MIPTRLTTGEAIVPHVKKNGTQLHTVIMLTSIEDFASMPAFAMPSPKNVMQTIFIDEKLMTITFFGAVSSAGIQ